MHISISTPTYDPKGLILLDYDSKSQDGTLSRRVSRTATMDGGCTYDDLGFSWSDVDLSLQFLSLSKDQQEQLSYLVKTYGELVVVTRLGAMKALVESYSFRDGRADLKLLIVGVA
jgi:hypothetical protein